nr:adrenodoxin-like protein 2, mitochondrial isoform X1 [Ipomoea batatas]
MERGKPKFINSITAANFFPYFRLIAAETHAGAGRILRRRHCYVINLPGSWLLVEIQNLPEHEARILLPLVVVLLNREPGRRLRFLVGSAVATAHSPYAARLIEYSNYEEDCYIIIRFSLRRWLSIKILRVTRHQQFCSEAGSNNSEEGQKISVTFVDKDGEEHHIKVPLGMSMLEAAHQNDIDLEGACEGSIACSTCHVIVMDVDYYNKLEDPSDEENDMLDLAFGLTETSRLGCQIVATPELDGIRLALPAATRNFAVDGYKPKPH